MTKLEEINYYFIIDERSDITPFEQAEIALDQGVKMIQYRRKNASGRVLYEEASRISETCKDRALFIVNDRVDVALAVDADGVHLGQDDLPYRVVRELVADKILGVSTHSVDQAIQAQDMADYIGVGPVHSTDTKQDKWDELGVQGAIDIADSVDVPTAAIGGIEYQDLKPLSKSFDMVCAISSVTQYGDPSENIKKFESIFKKFKEDRP